MPRRPYPCDHARAWSLVFCAPPPAPSEHADRSGNDRSTPRSAPHHTTNIRDALVMQNAWRCAPRIRALMGNVRDRGTGSFSADTGSEVLYYRSLSRMIAAAMTAMTTTAMPSAKAAASGNQTQNQRSTPRSARVSPSPTPARPPAAARPPHGSAATAERRGGCRRARPPRWRTAVRPRVSRPRRATRPGRR